MFDSLKYVKMLQKVGVSREQADTEIEIMTDIVEKNLATKQGLKDFEVATKQSFAELRVEFKGVTSLVEQEFKLLRSEMKQIEYRMTIKLGSVVTIVAGLAAAFLKYA